MPGYRSEEDANVDAGQKHKECKSSCRRERQVVKIVLVDFDESGKDGKTANGKPSLG